MEIPTDSLRKLPEGAIFSQRDGHLTLDLSMRGDTLVATAKSDSLPCLELAVSERISERAESSVEERSTVEHEPKASFWRCLVAFVIGFIGGALGGWLASKIKI